MSRQPAIFPVAVGVAVMTLLVLQGIIPQSEGSKKSKSKGAKLSNEIPWGKGSKSVLRDMSALPPFIQDTVKAFKEVESLMLVDKMSPSDKNYVGAVNKCADKIKLCPHTTLSASVCSLGCIFDQFSHLRHTIYLINEITLKMCSYTETVFDGMMRNFDSDIRTVEQFLNLHHSHISEGGAGHAIAAAGAVNFQIIKLSNLTSLDGLKLFLGSIYASNSAAKVANIGFTDRDVQNDVCPHVDYSDSTQRLAEEMISKPTLSDIILEGYFSLSHIVTLGSFGPAAPLFQATMSVMKALTGVECGLLDFVATGTTIDCSTIVGKKRVNVKPSKSVRPEDGGDPICGVKMDIPPVELGEKFPQAYPFKVLEAVDVYDYVDPLRTPVIEPPIDGGPDRGDGGDGGGVVDEGGDMDEVDYGQQGEGGGTGGDKDDGDDGNGGSDGNDVNEDEDGDEGDAEDGGDDQDYK